MPEGIEFLFVVHEVCKPERLFLALPGCLLSALGRGDLSDDTPLAAACAQGELLSERMRAGILR